MTAKKRIDTLRVLIGQHAALSESSKLAALYGELNRILAVRTAKQDSRWLLSVLHTTRALDTTLSVIVAAKGGTGSNLNDYLKVLAKMSFLTSIQVGAFRKEIVYKRNKYMHEAGATPQQLEADTILREMESCLAIVVSRVT